MAKGLRSSRNKTNNTTLRSKVFGPIENARKERLSAKLLQLAATPKPSDGGNTGMDLGEKDQEREKEKEKELGTDTAGPILHDEDLDADQATVPLAPTKPTEKISKRIEKKGRCKAKASMVFPMFKKGRRTGPRLSARQKKQSLKP